ncbi:MAG: DUF1501 domain-containing protein [Polyangia bacterium]
MDRRSFLKLAATSGIAVMAPTAFTRPAYAAGPRYGGPFFVLIHAGGGWDPTYLCDPKGSDGPVNINKAFKVAEIAPIGLFKTPPSTVDYGAAGMKPFDFVTKYKSQLLVINGIDTTTGNHDTGTRVIWSGRVQEGYPGFAAVLAAAKTPGNPLGFISSGGYETTAGLTSVTRLGNIDTMQRVAYPNRRDPANPMSLYHTDATWNRINQAQRDRLASLRDGTQVPRLNRGQAALYLARDPANDLATLAAALPTQAAINAAGNSLQRQAMVAAAGFKTGLAVAANMSIGGFDTHGNHDQNHIPLMGSLLAGIDLVMTEMANAGLAGKVVVCVGSDFGRTPAYNAQNGKDHWNITSMMFMGPGIAGGRVVGGTDANFKAKTFNPSTLVEDPNGIRIQPEHIQKALRSLAGITDSDPARQFPLSAAVQDLRLFTP